MITLDTTDRAGLAWAQQTITKEHYIRSNRESNRDRATRIVNAILDVVARGSELPTDLFRQEAIARAARIIGGDA